MRADAPLRLIRSGGHVPKGGCDVPHGSPQARPTGIDVHKESLVACLRRQDGRRKQAEVQSFGTTTAEILRLHAWLSAARCKHVAMESTGVYWQPVFNLLEGSFVVVLANAHHIKAVPGQKTDVKDCEWLADLLFHELRLLDGPRSLVKDRPTS